MTRGTPSEFDAAQALSLEEALERFGGDPIPRCPGRFVLRLVAPTEGPQTICPSARSTSHQVARARDTVVVTDCDGWGLISYARANGTWVHTANSGEGFERKLAELGIEPGGTHNG